MHRLYFMRTHQLTRPDGRAFKLKTYTPKINPLGLVLISPGAGGSENSYWYLADYFSNQGYLVGVMEHLESNLESLRAHTKHQGLKKGLMEMVTDPLSFWGRMMEIQEVLNWADGAVSGPKILVGHSMGAATVMMEAGAKNKLNCLGKDRFDAYIALSPQGPGLIFPEGAWVGLNKPMLLITGTKDHELDGDWTSRLLPFENMNPGTQKWLGVIQDADHMSLAGVGLSREPEGCVLELVGLFFKKNIGLKENKTPLLEKIKLTIK
ncbi:MAG: hypothetical protein RLZZ438_447 [Acidobacteriota bacterium]|jgi:predicted dienelactone hydrolase